MQAAPPAFSLSLSLSVVRSRAWGSTRAAAAPARPPIRPTRRSRRSADERTKRSRPIPHRAPHRAAARVLSDRATVRQSGVEDGQRRDFFPPGRDLSRPLRRRAVAGPARPAGRIARVWIVVIVAVVAVVVAAVANLGATTGVVDDDDVVLGVRVFLSLANCDGKGWTSSAKGL
jgi:hypothetical protein